MEQSNLISELAELISESQNSDTLDIDLLSTKDVVKSINRQDHLVSKSITNIISEVAQAVDCIVKAFKCGGRLIYFGAGTSGRLGVLDAVECVPTFGVDEGMVVGIIAGGESAMFKAQEGCEDSLDAAIDDLKSINLSDKDVLVGIAASGRTPYVIGGLKYAKQIGTTRIAISSNPKAEIAQHADIALLTIVGAETLAGSSRMKSGSAQKMLLNILSTASMIRIGKSYQNLMVDVKASNEKLYARGLRMVMQITGVEQAVAEQALDLSGKNVKLAVLMLLAEVDRENAEKLLEQSDGFLRKALQLV